MGKLQAQSFPLQSTLPNSNSLGDRKNVRITKGLHDKYAFELKKLFVRRFSRDFKILFELRKVRITNIRSKDAFCLKIFKGPENFVRISYILNSTWNETEFTVLVTTRIFFNKRLKRSCRINLFDNVWDIGDYGPLL